MTVVESRRGEYTASTDRARLDVDFVHDFLSRSSYWARGRTHAAVRASIEHSLCFGLYRETQQVGFARVVTDYTTFAWLCDFFVAESHRGQGLGKWLIECVVDHPALLDLGIFVLATRDAHELYRRYGSFQELQMPEKWMSRPRKR